MRTYPQRVRDNILPLSVAEALPEAFQEWSFTENTVDHETATEICQLCEHENLRYHFEIRNSCTSHTLWVGSQCILQFDIPVFEGGHRLSQDAARTKLDRLVQQMRLNSCLKALTALATAEANNILSSALTFYARNKYLTPKLAFVVFWKLAQHGVDHSPSFFKISLKRSQYKDDLRKMPSSRVHVIWPALSASQRRMGQDMGHAPPTDQAPPAESRTKRKIPGGGKKSPRKRTASEDVREAHECARCGAPAVVECVACTQCNYEKHLGEELDTERRPDGSYRVYVPVQAQVKDDLGRTELLACTECGGDIWEVTFDALCDYCNHMADR